MKKEQVSPIEVLHWDGIRGDVQQLDKTLAGIIDNINPDKRHKLFRITYSFGDLILKDGLLQIPYDNGGVLPLTDVRVDSKLRENLSYSVIPLFLTLKNSSEVFLDTGSRIIPLNLFNQGSLLGLFESIDFQFNRVSRPRWSVSAGARSIFMLPKLKHSIGMKRLRLTYKLPSATKVETLSDHWDLFVALSKQSVFNQTWKNQVLFFGKEWLVWRNDPKWIPFYKYLFQHAWSQAQFAIGKIDLSLSWELFIDALSSRRLKPIPYLADQVKHILLIAAAKWPAFRPADSSERTAPVKSLQAAIVETYQLKDHLPTIMHPYLLNANDKLPGYYSLTLPTLLEGSPHNKRSSTIMLDLRDIKLMLDIFLQTAVHHKRFDTVFLGETGFEYFHVEPDMFEEIQSSDQIPQDDPGFSQGSENYPHHSFCATSPFWRGCIRINPDKKKAL